MRVLLADKTGVMDSADERCRALACYDDIDLHLMTPDWWIESGRKVYLPDRENIDYTIHRAKAGFRGNYARGFYRGGMKPVVKSASPQMLQILEEPWSFFAFQAVRGLRGSDIPLAFYTWENIFRENTYPSKISFLFRMIEKQCYQRANGAVCATESARGVLWKKGFRKPIAVIPYGIDAGFFDVVRTDRAQVRKQLGLPDDFLIGYVGRLLEMKGIDTLIGAFAGLKEGRLIIVGTGPEQERLQGLASRLGVSDRIVFTGSLPHGEVSKYIRALDVLALPSRTTPMWMEQLGRVLLEAMAAGTAVVGSSSGAIPEVIGEAGLVFPEGDRDALRLSLNSLQSCPSSLTCFQNKGLERVTSRFTWPRFAGEMREFWQSLNP